MKGFMEFIYDFSVINIILGDEAYITDIIQADKIGAPKMMPKIIGHKILQLINKFILKGLVPLE